MAEVVGLLIRPSLSGSRSATSKDVEISCEIDYTISFWSWILLWKSLHFMEISTFCGYYLHFMEVSKFRGYYLHFLGIYVLRGYYPHFVEISTSCGYYPHFVDIIYIDHINSYLARNLHHIFHIYSFSESDWCINYFPVCNLIVFLMFLFLLPCLFC